MKNLAVVKIHHVGNEADEKVDKAKVSEEHLQTNQVIRVLLPTNRTLKMTTLKICPIPQSNKRLAVLPDLKTWDSYVGQWEVTEHYVQ